MPCVSGTLLKVNCIVYTCTVVTFNKVPEKHGHVYLAPPCILAKTKDPRSRDVGQCWTPWHKIAIIFNWSRITSMVRLRSKICIDIRHNQWKHACKRVVSFQKDVQSLASKLTDMDLGIDVLVNSAGMSFAKDSAVPFDEQAKVSRGIKSSLQLDIPHTLFFRSSLLEILPTVMIFPSPLHNLIFFPNRLE